MTVEHFAEVELYEDGGGAFVRFVCTGTDEDLCRQWCAEGCEESCNGGLPIRWTANGPGVELVAQAPVDGHRWEPTPRIGESSCREMDWLDAVGWQDTGWVDDPDPGVGEREVAVRDLRDGRHRIEIEWTGDDYVWRYPAAVVSA